MIMSGFIVSARKYRPESFDTVVGQDTITRTLKNAIRKNQLAHAYLFCGPRGVGKTTCARIFAKTINCLNITAETEACNQCESCASFRESRSFNIHELDAASNNTVDDIRSLTDQVRIPPQIGKYSIYIIDEVHMLSASAFNAFLKTLEEPPHHAIFILATTQKEKIIPTVLSRCQIFDFHRIKVTDIVNHLSYVASSEGVKAGPDVLSIIAQKADGAMRDALSIFDQIVSYSGKELSYAQIIESLNVLDYEYYFRMTSLFLEGNVADTLILFNEIMEKGFDPHTFLNGLSRHFRDLLVCRDPATIVLLDVADSVRERYLQQSAAASAEFLFLALEVVNQFDIHFRNSRNQRLHTELALIRLCRLINPSGTATEKKNPDVKDTGEAARSERKKTPAYSEGNTPSDTVAETTSGKQEREKKQPADQKPKVKTKTTTPSIKKVLKGMLEEKSQAGEIPDEPEKNTSTEGSNKLFTAEELETYWKTFAATLEPAKPRMAITLKNRQLQLMSGHRVAVVFDNTDQLADFNRDVKPGLTDYLKKNLCNDSILIDAAVRETAPEKFIYTPEEKYEFLKQKNPALENLKKTFNLDFE